MAVLDFEPAIRARLARAGITLEPPAASQLAAYLAVLARWNRRINLTAFDLDRANGRALDRLIVEPAIASGEIRSTDAVVIDVGSGGGSPALPLKILRPHIRLTMIEARVRKSAFLREAARELALSDVHVETFRLARSGHPALNATADVVTMRAVRPDVDLLSGVGCLLARGGRLVMFSDRLEDVSAGLPGWTEAAESERTAPFLRVLRPER